MNQRIIPQEVEKQLGVVSKSIICSKGERKRWMEEISMRQNWWNLVTN